MKRTRWLFFYVCFILSSCAQTSQRSHIDPLAIRMNDSAMALFRYGNMDSTQKALSYLDKATKLDSNYYLGFSNKRIVQTQLKLYRDLITTTKSLIRLRPLAPDFYLSAGTLYEKLNDSVSATKYYEQALILYNHLLDTVSLQNGNYDIFFMDRALDIILLGDQNKGDSLLKQLYDRQTDDDFRQMTLSFMNKNKKKLIEFIFADRQPANKSVEAN
jgi:tetratricopeptide (TPR) repeat protein